MLFLDLGVLLLGSFLAHSLNAYLICHCFWLVFIFSFRLHVRCSSIMKIYGIKSQTLRTVRWCWGTWSHYRSASSKNMRKIKRCKQITKTITTATTFVVVVLASTKTMHIYYEGKLSDRLKAKHYNEVFAYVCSQKGSVSLCRKVYVSHRANTHPRDDEYVYCKRMFRIPTDKLCISIIKLITQQSVNGLAS